MNNGIFKRQLHLTQTYFIKIRYSIAETAVY